MIKTPKALLRILYVSTDLIFASVAWMIFNIIRYHRVAHGEGFNSLSEYLTFDRVWHGQILIPVCWLALYYFSGYYNRPFPRSRLWEFFITLFTVMLGSVLIFFVFVLNDLPHSFQTYYDLFFNLFALQFLLTYIPRLSIAQWSRRKFQEDNWRIKLMIIGAGSNAHKLAREITKRNYSVVGFIRTRYDAEDLATPRHPSPTLGTVDELPRLSVEHPFDELIVAPDTISNEELLKILYTLYTYNCPIRVLRNSAYMLARAKIRDYIGMPLIEVTESNMSEAGRNIKLWIDKTTAAIALVILAPILAAIALYVRIGSRGGALFRQQRIGYRGKPFTIYKFRTMYADSEKDGPQLSSTKDSRITLEGEWLRKYRLDELPQLWNVMIGDMSLVGPRPERKFFIDQIVRQAPHYYLLHNVKPGITSLGMVKYGYAKSVDEMIERLDYDILYYENMSLTFDLFIASYTIRTILLGKGL